jgi:hypothetical protein
MKNMNSLFGAFLLAAVGFLSLPVAAFGEAVVLPAPHAVGVDNKGNVIAGCHGDHNLYILSRTGEQIARFGADRLVYPTGIVVDAKGVIYVTNPGRGEVAVYDGQGKFLTSYAGLANPQGLALSADGLIYVADTDKHRIAVYRADPSAPEGSVKEPLFVIDKVLVGGKSQEFKRLMGVAVAGDRLAASDSENHCVLIMPRPLKAGEVRAKVIGPANSEPQWVAMGRDGRVYVVDRRQVRGYALDGGNFANYTAAASVYFDPITLTMDSAGSLYVMDRGTGRALVTNADLADFTPELKFQKGDPTTVTVEWTTLRPAPTKLTYGTSEECGSVAAGDARPTTKHSLVLKGLKPATRYYYHVLQAAEAVPSSAAFPKGRKILESQAKNETLMADGYSCERVIITRAEPGKTEWAAMPTLVVVYKNIAFEADKDGKKQPNRILNDEAIKLLRSEMEIYRLWAWRQSSCKLNIEFNYIFVDEERKHTDLNRVSPIVLADMLAGLKAQGRDIHDYWNAIMIATHGWYAEYMGFAEGSDVEMEACHLMFSNETRPGFWWFPTHENGHVIDFMLEASGCPIFHHPDFPWLLPGQFGENFSFLAFNYRHVPITDWLTMRRTVLHQSADANESGVPDDDLAVPLDKKRFGWTREMGGDCLKRVMAGVRLPGYPGDTDTDFEGHKHKLNEGEPYWVVREAHKGTPLLDGKIDEKEWKEFYSVPNMTTPAAQRDLKAKLYVAWDDKNFYFAIKSDKQVIAGIDLDAANNGWFHGRDNLRLTLRPGVGGKPPTADGSIWDFINDQINPKGELWYAGAYKPGDIKVATGQQDGWYVIECAVPERPNVNEPASLKPAAEPQLQIMPGKGRKFAFRAYMWTENPNPSPQTGFLDGEDFIYTIVCVEK